jgi:hypothetical protein
MIGESRAHVQYLFFIGWPRVIPLIYRMRAIHPNSASLPGPVFYGPDRTFSLRFDEIYPDLPAEVHTVHRSRFS